MKNAFLCSFAVSLRMEGDLTWIMTSEQNDAETVSLRMEGDLTWGYSADNVHFFRRLPPHGGRPDLVLLAADFLGCGFVSLRMEGDLTWFYIGGNDSMDTGLPPHGGRPDLGILTAIQ